MSKIRLSGIIRESIVDGPGIRFVIFTQGCNHNCKGCQNIITHDVNGGYISDTENLLNAIKQNPLLSGVTFSGGEPFLQAKPLAELAKQIHSIGLDVITYTGYTIEKLMRGINEDNGWKDLLEQTDILIDGPFIAEKKSLLLEFRGSSNQRIIDPRSSLKLGRAIEKTFCS